jgi:hypothetical protein
LPYGSDWYRAVACILLSGRVRATNDGTPDMTEVKRVTKEANFNQYLTERVGTFLVAADVIRFNRQNRYEVGPNLAAFWARVDAKLPEVARHAVARLAGHQTGRPLWMTEADEDWGLSELVSLLFTCFRGLPWSSPRWTRFSTTSPDCLRMTWCGRSAGSGGLASGDVAGWQLKLDARCRKA